MSEWLLKKLADVCVFQRGYDLPKTKMIDGLFPVAGSNSIIGYHNEYTTIGPSVTIGRSGNIGTPYYYEGNFWAHNTVLYVKEFWGNWPKFVYYLLKTIDFGQYNAGSAVPTLNRNHIHEHEILLPPLPEQQAIAEVLSSLDDKIDLLHRNNKTLEEMAETLFRQWFVEGAKEEWEESNLLDRINLIGGGTPKTTIEAYWNGQVPWLSGGDIAKCHKGFVTSSEKSISEEGLRNSSAKLLPKYSTVITARGTVGKYCLLSKAMTYSQSNYGITPKIDGTFFYTYLLVANCVEALSSAAYGSVFDTITTATFQGVNIQNPPVDLILRFEECISPVFERILNNYNQIEKLSSIRNSLLPKLMSGQVRVGNN